ncbi:MULTISPECIES: PTS cellobiose transporter subunit IIC [Carnobacterium]|jgi:PTS system cellobiose-specific IIC component|uniref:Permease IIC component n=2 Tax=Carnobacterium maltaromaticum TaxID=2751 RepID=K8EKY4_CARML|nr:PTS cellobiose transporter subunit IIC [Carnobacterium maltaromaticum]AOA03108.1 PTS system, cellobiose-specific IIC component [Carnobacterium maltaromaticum]KRN72237.1 phosphotransferase system enzyme IIC permease component [Carnobacterium maltaromaticum]MBC9809383.1 PTS cellobiose transporter subunit IIC [Carnobacterium maltaromaticum]MCI1817664.1 PTS cellobiose transporter subunit IIC [Carnobacterium maltaromaticum]MDW5524550.1 PTS cellobiose transporter subunit IIC [Carnobacterium malta
MDKFLDVLQEKMGPIAYKLDSNRYLSAIKTGFFGAMPILIIGSVFLLFANLPIPGYADFMASIMGENWTTYFMVPYDMTMNIMTIFVVFGIAKDLAHHYKVDDLAAVVIAVVAFFILTPTIADTGGANGIPTSNLGASGLFVGMITAILAVEISRWVEQRGWTIKMPDSVPSNVARSFTALIPAFFVIVIFDLIRIGFSFTAYDTAQAFIFQILQTPLTALGSSLPATIVVLLFEGLLWSFGIHGSNIVGAVMQPIWLSLTADNAAAFSAHEALPHIVNYQFYSNFIKVGGAGGTLGLAILCVFVAKSAQFKTLGKLAIAPGIFNINEPLIFGIPIVLNPVMMIPFIITPVVLAIVAYFAMATGLVDFTNGTNLPWTTPPIVSGFLLNGWRGALLQVVQIGLSMAIYFPFFKLEDNKAYQLELEGAHENQTPEEALA